MRTSLFLATAAALSSLTGCASIVNGTGQTLSVSTVSSSDGASVDRSTCSLQNGKGSWFVTTPGSVTVHRASGALNIRCTHKGYQPGIASAESATKAMAFGNILFGGIIGAGVDIADGAAYRYPNLITVPMTPAPIPPARNAERLGMEPTS